MSATAPNRPAFLDAAIAAFDGDRLMPIEVPEWPAAEGRPTIVYYKPITLAEKKAIRQAVGGDFEDPAVLAEVCIRKLLDGDGNRLLTVEHKPDLMHRVSPDTLKRIALTILYVVPVAVAEKN